MCMLPMSIALPPKLYHSKQYEQIYKDDFGKRIVLILKEKKTNENKLLEPKEMHKKHILGQQCIMVGSDTLLWIHLGPYQRKEKGNSHLYKLKFVCN